MAESNNGEYVKIVYTQRNSASRTVVGKIIKLREKEIRLMVCYDSSKRNHNRIGTFFIHHEDVSWTSDVEYISEEEVARYTAIGALRDG